MTLSFLISLIISLLSAILGMSFFTLFERKILGYIQLRKGPNKVSVSGIPQPIADAIKLFSKEHTQPFKTNLSPFIFVPVLALILSITTWMLCPNINPFFFLSFSIIMFIAISSMNVFIPLIAGWASNSKYALLGAMRSLAQTISYEISMALIILSILLIYSSFSINSMNFMTFINPFSMTIHLLFMWFISILAETNRAPFDFAEGESEIVSGFNIEYSSSGFALLFMAEYMAMLVMSMLTVTLFFSIIFLSIWGQMNFALNTTFYAFLFIWVRGSFPRMRYDHLMFLTWKSFLPLTLSLVILLTSTLNFIL